VLNAWITCLMHGSHDTHARTRAETHRDMQNHHIGHSIASVLRTVTVFQPKQLSSTWQIEVISCQPERRPTSLEC
jgi:hypothetical protein